MFIPNPYFYPSRIRNTANKCHTVMKCRQSSQICESLISSSDRAPGQLITDPPDPSPRYCHGTSFADPGYLSRILIFTHPGSRIQKQQQKTGAKIFFCQTIFCIHKFHKTEYYFIYDMLKKKIWPNFPRIIEVFTQKIVTKPSKIWVWDPGSGIRDPEKKLFRLPDPQHCKEH